MASIFNRIDDFINNAYLRFKRKPEPKINSTQPNFPPSEQPKKAIELATEYGFLTSNQTGILLSFRDISGAIHKPDNMHMSPEEHQKYLAELAGAMEGSGRLFGRGNANKAASLLAQALVSSLGHKAEKQEMLATAYDEMAEKNKAENPEVAEQYRKKAAAFRKRAEDITKTAYWYCGTTEEESKANPGVFHPDAEGPKFLKNLILENKSFIREVVEEAKQGNKLSLGELAVKSGFISADKEIATSVVDGLFSAKTALRTDRITSLLPENVADLKKSIATETLPLERVKVGKATGNPAVDMNEAAVDLLSARVHMLLDANLTQEEYTVLRNQMVELRSASWSLVHYQLGSTPAAKDERAKHIVNKLEEKYSGQLMAPEKAAEKIAATCADMAASLVLARLKDNPEFASAVEPQDIVNAFGAAVSKDAELQKIVGYLGLARSNPEQFINAIVAGKAKQSPKKLSGEEKIVVADAELNADQPSLDEDKQAPDGKKKHKDAEALALDDKKKKPEGKSDAEVQAMIDAAIEQALASAEEKKKTGSPKKDSASADDGLPEYLRLQIEAAVEAALEKAEGKKKAGKQEGVAEADANALQAANNNAQPGKKKVAHDIALLEAEAAAELDEPVVVGR